eukprot:scaffold426_cov219-Amphora_coffeaeformis.AAC.46
MAKEHTKTFFGHVISNKNPDYLDDTKVEKTNMETVMLWSDMAAFFNLCQQHLDDGRDEMHLIPHFSDFSLDFMPKTSSFIGRVDWQGREKGSE